MTIPELEEFLKQNKIQLQQAKQDKEERINKTEQTSQEQIQCIFCAISQGKVPSYKIDENKDSIVVLEINPISKGHSLVIPKNHIEEIDKIPSSAFSLAKKISKKIKTKFSPKEIEIHSTKVMNHAIINILPIYSSETLNTERKKSSEQELKELQKQLEKKSSSKIAKTKSKKILKKSKESVEKLWLPRRIP